jgi:hypothetical protein
MVGLAGLVRMVIGPVCLKPVKPAPALESRRFDNLRQYKNSPKIIRLKIVKFGAATPKGTSVGALRQRGVLNLSYCWQKNGVARWGRRRTNTTRSRGLTARETQS